MRRSLPLGFRTKPRGEHIKGILDVTSSTLPRARSSSNILESVSGSRLTVDRFFEIFLT